MGLKLAYLSMGALLDIHVYAGTKPQEQNILMFWLEVCRKVDGCSQLLSLREDLAVLPHVLVWACSGSRKESLFKVWFLAVAWRCLWVERCTLAYQGKRNSVSLTKVSIIMLEEINAMRHKLPPRLSKDFATHLVSFLAVIPPRFQKLLADE
ncbi:hypothetical protein R1sor_014033 [Riccia sorocarpa]|uniref:Maturase K n=1 Tax=Riccia sorocarpa TaxID=122646 RepID=A0ABD3HEE8_9MARC